MTNKAIGRDKVKSRNFYQILSLLHQRGPLPRKDIAEIIELTPSAVTLLTNELIGIGVLAEGAAIKSERSGRKKIEIEINEDYGYVLAINVERTEITIALSCFGNRKIWGEVIEVNNTNSFTQETFAQLIESVVKTHCQRDQIEAEKIRCIGISCVGFVDPQEGVLKNSFGLFEAYTPIKEYLEAYFGIPVYVENNVRALAMLELYLRHFVNDKTSENNDGLFLKHGPGFGGTILFGNETFNGSDNRSGEIGHVKVSGNEEDCFCGRRGCLSTMISRSSIIKQALKHYSKENTKHLCQITEGDPQKVSLHTILESALHNDGAIVQMMENAAMLMAQTIDNAMMIIDGEIIFVYGELLCEKWFFERLQYHLDETSNYTRKYVLVKSIIHNQWQAAVIIALRNYFRFLSENIK